jgi:hypothetical protein
LSKATVAGLALAVLLGWDVGPGETASLPTKWMSADGKTVHLVFSGDDHFAVRKASLTAGAPDISPPR